jgi:ABC-type uncharacterized transport system involved in gliding motility auxiliary subunit
LQYQTRLPSGAVQFRIVRYPLWIGVPAGNGNPDHPVSVHFQGLDLFWSSPLELHPSQLIEVVPLFTSTAEAWSMKDTFYTSPEAAYLFEREAPRTKGTKILGASLNGTFPSYFSGAPQPLREGSEEELPDMPLGASPSRIIVVGDTDFATNIINVSGANHNLDFLLRAADWLSSDDDIIGIRNRQPQTGRLDRILDPAMRASAMRFSQVINVGIVPLLVSAAGLYLAWQRRSRSRNAGIKTAKESSDDV